MSLTAISHQRQSMMDLIFYPMDLLSKKCHHCQNSRNLDKCVIGDDLFSEVIHEYPNVPFAVMYYKEGNRARPVCLVCINKIALNASMAGLKVGLHISGSSVIRFGEYVYDFGPDRIKEMYGVARYEQWVETECELNIPARVEAME